MARKKQSDEMAPEIVEPGPPAEPEAPAQDEPALVESGQVQLIDLPASPPPPGHEPPSAGEPEGVPGPAKKKRTRRSKAELEAERAKQAPLSTGQPVQAGPSANALLMAQASAQLLEGAWSTAVISYPEDVQAKIARLNTDMRPKREAVLVAPMAYVETELGPNGVLIVSLIALAGMELAMYAAVMREIQPYQPGGSLGLEETEQVPE